MQMYARKADVKYLPQSLCNPGAQSVGLGSQSAPGAACLHLSSYEVTEAHLHAWLLSLHARMESILPSKPCPQPPADLSLLI